jgi:hypothetical protein
MAPTSPPLPPSRLGWSTWIVIAAIVLLLALFGLFFYGG